MSLCITGVGSAVPSSTLTNHHLAQWMDTSDEWIVERTGIRERRVLQREETLLQLAGQAAGNAIKDAEISPPKIDLLVCATVQGDDIFPSLASRIQEMLSLDCPAVDINVACAGFLYGLDIAQAYFDGKKATCILLVCAEAMSRVIDWSDRRTCILFGDGAGAAVVEAGEGLLSIEIQNKPQRDWLYAEPVKSKMPGDPLKRNWDSPHVVMNGQEIYRYAVTYLVDQARELTKKAGINLDEVNHFILHQANLRILEAVRLRLKQPKEKFPTSIERYGNMSSASIPILLAEERQVGRFRSGDILFLSAFGAGMAAGSCLLRWK